MNKGYVYSTLSAVFFGSAGLIIKLAYAEGSDSVNLLIFQYILAVLIMFLLILLWNQNALKISGKDLLHTAVLGIAGNTFMTIFYYLAFSYLQVSLVAILLYTYPIMVFIYSFLFENQKIDKNKFIALMIAFTGCILALGLAQSKVTISIIGLVCGLLSALFYSFMNIYSEKRLEHLNSLTINFYATAFSLLSLMIYRFPLYIFKGQFTIRLLSYTAILALVCEIIPLTLLYAAIKQIGSLKVSIIGNLEIPTAMILSYLFLGEVVTPLQIIGAAMVIYAVYRIRK